jgi:hypothetical protein
MEKNELNNEKEPTTSQPEMTQDGELTDEELDTVDGGLLPAVQKNPANVVAPGGNSKQAQHGIIAILIGL